jgi:hypothetical protein
MSYPQLLIHLLFDFFFPISVREPTALEETGLAGEGGEGEEEEEDEDESYYPRTADCDDHEKWESALEALAVSSV